MVIKFLIMNYSNEMLVSLTVDQLKDVISEAIGNKEHTPTEKNGKDLMTRFEVMEYFNISAPTINRWVKKGTLRKVKVGHKVFFNRSEIEQMSIK